MKNINIAVYTRVSTKDQALSGLGLEAQLRNINQYIDIYYPGAKLYYYQDGGATGTDINRRELQKMLADINVLDIHHVVIYKIDRLSRNLLDYITIAKQLEMSGVGLISISEQFDTSTPLGKAMSQLLATFAEMESNMISQRTKDALISNLEKGYYPFTTPWGYIRIENKKMIVDANKKEVIEYIFNRFLEIKQYTKIAEEIDLLFNVQLSDDFIKKILLNQVYTGSYSYNDKEYIGILPEVIDKPTYQKVLETIKEKNRIVVSTIDYVFGDCVWCSECKKEAIKVSGNKPNKKYYYYRCSCNKKYLSVEVITSMIKYSLLQYINEMNYKIDNTMRTRKIRDLKEKLKTLEKSYLNNEITLNQYIDIKTIIATKKQAIKKELFYSKKIDLEDIRALSFYVEEYIDKIEINFKTKQLKKIHYKK